MASFTDESHLKFDPYIQQVPVDDYLRVGMMKQEQYNQGVQEVQQAESNTSGLDIVQGAQKQYLQNSMNIAGGELKKYAGADYSNQQLVNSLTGMINKVAKDPIIQNGVSSTMNYRKGLADMQEARKAGKSSPDNEWDYMNNASKWLNGDVNSSFNSGYTPYVDVHKKALEVLKTLHADKNLQDIPFVRDAQGNIDYSKIAVAMQEQGVEGISAAKLENAVRASFDENDLNQLSISGRYQFRNYTPDNLVQHVNSQYNATIESANNKIEELEKFAKMNASNIAAFNQAKESIAKLKEQIADGGILQQKRDAQISFVKNNPDEAKAQIYKDGFVNQFANAFSWEDKTLKYLDNPIVKQENWKSDFKLKNLEFNDKVRHEGVEEAQGWQRLGLEKDKLDIDIKKLYGASTGFSTYTGLDTDIKSPVVAMQNDLSNHTNAADTMTAQIAKELGVTAGQVTKQINDYQNLPNGKSNIPPNLRGLADRIIKERNEAKAIDNALSKAKASVLNSDEVINKKKEIDNQVKSLPALTLGSNKISNEEIFNLIRKEREIQSRDKAGAIVYTKDFNEGDLSDREKFIYHAIKGDMNNSGTPVGKTIQQYRQASINNNGVLNDINKGVEREIATKYTNWVPKISNLELPTEAARTHFENIAGSVVLRPNTDNGSNLGLDRDKVSKWLSNPSDKKELQYKVFNQGEHSQLWIMNGKEVQKLDLTPEEASQIPNATPSQNMDAVTRMRLNGGNTNGMSDPVGSFFQQSDFPNIKSFNVTADLQAEYGDYNKVYPVFNLRTPSGWKSITWDKPMDITNAKNMINSLSDDLLKELYLKHGLPQWTEEIKKLK